MRVRISVPDDVFAQAGRLARQRNVSRSQLDAGAIRRLLRDERSIIERLDEVHGTAQRSEGGSSTDSAVDRATVTLLADADW